MFSTGLFRLLAISALIALAMSLALPTPATSADGDDNEFPVPEKPELAYPNLGSTLDQLVTMVEKGEASAKQATEDAPVHQEESVAVTIYLSENVADVVKFLEDNGSSPRNVGEDYIEAYVPVSLLGQLSEQPGVIRVREIVPPEPEYGDFTSQGVQAHLSEAWNQAGYSGQGVKVGIIDVGFKDLTSLMGTELPATVQARCYTDIGVFTQDLADCEAVDDVTTSPPECLDYVRDLAARRAVHGTIVAESVIDIAPEVTLYIAKPQSRGDLRDATDWMVSEDVSVINYSVIWPFDGPGDGTSPLNASPLNTVDRAVASDIIWVNSAGNSAQETWFGGYSDPDDDRFINFISGDVEVNSLPLRACRSYRVQLRWEDDWNGASTDLDLYLYHIPSRTFTTDYSEDEQSGQSGHVPFETFFFRSRVNSDDFGIVVVHHGGDVPDWIQLAVWAVDPIQHHTGSGSITNPAESANPGMLAVGAAPWYDVNTIEPYSSRGPTPDGRVKPDIVGADCGETALSPLNQRQRGFCWTSQAAPHVAGMAALVRQRFPTYTPVQVADFLKEHAEQRETPDPNTTWGHGFATLPAVSECSAGVAVANAANNPGLVSDCDALLAARDALADAGTLNWSGSTAIGSWDGVTVSGSPLRVTNLALHESQLTGTIPPELGSLANLHELHLWGNQLSGPIPSELSSLSNLEVLALSSNQLTGPIPTWLGSLTNLRELYLWGNQLTGQIPSQLASLSNLEVLALSSNQLTGPVPTWLGSLTNLRELYLWGNQLTGQIPSQLASLCNLEVLALSSNQLTGPIPTWLGSLTNLRELYLGSNQFTGQIPSQLASLSKLERLSLSDNQLNGPVPTWLGNLTNLQLLYLSENQLSGMIPPELGNLTDLQRLRLSENQLTGIIPAELGNFADLEELLLSGNQLTGCIPAGIAGVANNDLDQLALPFCAGASGAPTIETVTPGADFLTVTWTAARVAGGTAITAYDLRYIESAASDKSDADWSIVDNAWTTGSGALSYQISGLTSGTQYDVQVRVVTVAGDGRWSAAVAGTPATWGAIRSFSPPSVAPAGEVVVMITASGYGKFGGVTETLPPGFSYVSSSLEDSGVTDVGREVHFSLFGQTAFTYTVTASSTEGAYSFSGVLRNSDREDVPVGGALTIAVAAGDPLIVRYDANGNGMIEKSEVIAAINHYLFGEGDAAISKSDVIKLINRYLFG